MCLQQSNSNNHPRFRPDFSGFGTDDDYAPTDLLNLLNACDYHTMHNSSPKNMQNGAFSMLHINIRSLPRNFDSFLQLLNKLNPKPSIIFVTELWLSSESTSMYEIKDYTFETSCPSEFRGKGAGIYILKGIPYSRRRDLESCCIQHQSVFLEISEVFRFSLTLGCSYRSPSFPSTYFQDYIESSLEKITNENKTCIIAGDFNFDLLQHNSCEASSLFLQAFTTQGFFPCISVPTRITSHSKTLIDNFFCNDISLVKSSSVLVSNISDHLPIQLQLTANIQQQKNKHSSPVSSFDFRKIENLKQNLAASLTNFQSISDPNVAANFLQSVLESEIAKFSIIRSSRRRVPFQPWISYNLLHCINKKNDLYKKFIKSQNNHDELMYKRYRNVLTGAIRTAKKLYYQRKIQEEMSKPKKLWSTLLDLTHKSKPKKDLPERFECNSTYLSDPACIANEFNKFFSTIASNLNASLPASTSDPLSYLDNPTGSCFKFRRFSAETIHNITSSLKNTGGGIDGIGSKILRLISPTITPHLTYLFNACIARGIFPDIFKKALVVPIFKAGNPSTFNNYRPISLLPILSKIFEKAVYQQISHYLNSNSILYNKQFGFRKNHSSYMPISLIYDQITSSLVSKKHCATVYLDFSKAFDTVNHSILLSKMKHYGIRNLELNFFKSYLSNRTQVVKYNSFKSLCPMSMPLGVPQGSVLGPLLFLLYINDIPKSSSGPDFYLFADDTALLFTGDTLSDLQRKIDHSLPQISSWLHCNRLSLNTGKSTYQLFSATRGQDLHIAINDSPIQRKFSTKYLGVQIDEDLRWTTHIKNVENTVARNIGLIYRCKHILDSRLLLLLYNAFILPFLSYGIQIWGSTYDFRLHKLHLLQKRVVRMIDGADRLAHSSPIFRKYQILKIHDIVGFSKIKILHSFLLGSLPSPMASQLNLIDVNVARRVVRRSQHFQIPFASTVYRKFSLFISAPRTWNNIVASKIRNLPDIPTSKVFFKKVARKLYLDSY